VQARRVAVVGAGWAGLAAAVRATEAGHAVTVFEMAREPGGRARSLAAEPGAVALDNGQHILIGAYRRTLQLMHTVGADPEALLHRRPLDLRFADGTGLSLPRGPAWLVFGAAVLAARGWGWRDKASLLRGAAGWMASGFRCAPGATVAALARHLRPAVRARLLDPLCVAALNTPADEASGAVFLRVLRDSLFAGPGSSDLLLPRAPLSQLLPVPALAWLSAQGATLRPGHRVATITRQGGRWQVDGGPFDVVILAASAAESARLVAPLNAAWAARAASFHYEPIVTVYLRAPRLRLPRPMTALLDGPDAPAQFVFDHGALGGEAGRFAFVVSGAARWVQAGLDATADAVLRQARAAFAPGTWNGATVERTLAEKRATFRCVPGLDRPPALIAAGLLAAGDYLEGPYPATLEGAVRSGEAAAASVGVGS
jgi:hydroxysqualene dehydroxylase